MATGDQDKPPAQGENKQEQNGNGTIVNLATGANKSKFPNPDIKQEYKSYSFGNTSSQGGMYIYFSGEYTTISLSKAKYIDCLKQIDVQLKTRKTAFTMVLVTNPRLTGNRTNIKYVKVDSAEHKNPRILLVTKVIDNKTDQMTDLQGIVIFYDTFKLPNELIYNPGKQDTAIIDDEAGSQF